MNDPTPPEPSRLTEAEEMIDAALSDVRIVMCPRCKGSGKIVMGMGCPDCRGSGLSTAVETDG